MRRLFSHPNLARCDLLRAVLELRGIECALRNEFSANTAGAAYLGPLPFAWPELWVREDQYAEAEQILRDEDPAADDKPGIA